MVAERRMELVGLVASGAVACRPSQDNALEQELMRYPVSKERFEKGANIMVSVYFFNCEDVVKEYNNIMLTPEIVAEIVAWIENDIEEAFVQIW